MGLVGTDSMSESREKETMIQMEMPKKTPISIIKILMVKNKIRKNLICC